MNKLMRLTLISLLIILAIGVYTVQANKPSRPSLQPLSSTERIEAESVIGAYSFLEEQTTAAINLPSIDNLLRGTSVTVSRINAEKVTNPTLVKRISDELGRLLGGWFSQDLTPYIHLYKSLVSQEMQEYYTNGGMTTHLDKPKTAFYYLAFQVVPWQVQALGELGVFHSISISQPLTKAKALQEGGHPVPRPLGAIEPFLADVTPNLPIAKLSDRSGEHTVNVFDTYLQDTWLTIKAGVRLSLTADNKEVSSEHPYHYSIRLNLDLRKSK
ncbi:MAG: hypothetical protein KME21_29900 [Desmonostoc vinosum HA7617-LM4]|jgi:hypothetical protein|nr:hypothetical protein [Desmonostoc vinosum HA7617-LM4]